MFQKNIQTPTCALSNLKAATVCQQGKVMHWRGKRLIGFKSPLKTIHCCLVSSITNPQQSTDLVINPVQGFSHTHLLNHSLCAAVIYATRWGRNHSLPFFSALLFLTSLWGCSAWCFPPWPLGRKGLCWEQGAWAAPDALVGWMVLAGCACCGGSQFHSSCVPATSPFRSATKNTHSGWVNPSAKMGEDSLAHLRTLGCSPM